MIRIEWTWPYCVISYITIRIQLELTQGRIAVYTPPLSQLWPDSYGHIENTMVGSMGKVGAMHAPIKNKTIIDGGVASQQS